MLDGKNKNGPGNPRGTARPRLSDGYDPEVDKKYPANPILKLDKETQIDGICPKPSVFEELESVKSLI